MAFSIKNWINGTQVDAAAMQDLESRLSGGVQIPGSGSSWTTVT